jgi:hypothetical protein
MVRRGTRATRAHDGRFFGRRVNCDNVPLLPGWAVARVLDDPQKIRYLLVWKSRSDDTVQEVVDAAPHIEPGAVEIRRQDGTSDFIRTVSRPLPRNGGSARFLVCPFCQIPRRGLYGWEPGGPFTISVVRSSWGCRASNKLRYASEGGALVLRGRGAIARMLEATFGSHHPDPHEPWYPYVFASAEEAMRAGVNVGH